MPVRTGYARVSVDALFWSDIPQLMSSHMQVDVIRSTCISSIADHTLVEWCTASAEANVWLLVHRIKWTPSGVYV